MIKPWKRVSGGCLTGIALLWLAASPVRAQVPLCFPNTLNHLGAGCEQLDKIFTNLALTNNNGPNASLIGTTFTGASETTGVTATFASAWTAISGFTGIATTHATIGYDVAVDPAFIAPNNQYWAITSASLAEAGAVALFANSSVKVMESFCLDSATFNCTSSSPNFAFIQYQLVGGNGGTTTDTTCFNNGNSSCSVNTGSLTLAFTGPDSIFQNGVQRIAVQDTLTLTAPAPIHITNLNAFSNTFVETAIPEPATFALAGFALAGCAIAAARRRRQAWSTLP